MNHHQSPSVVTGVPINHHYYWPWCSSNHDLSPLILPLPIIITCVITINRHQSHYYPMIIISLLHIIALLFIIITYNLSITPFIVLLFIYFMLHIITPWHITYLHHDCGATLHQRRSASGPGVSGRDSAGVPGEGPSSGRLVVNELSSGCEWFIMVTNHAY